MKPHRNKTLFLFTAFSASNFADGMFMIAIPLTVQSYNWSYSTSSLLNSIKVVPWLVSFLFAGHIIDRFSHRLIIKIASVLRFFILSLLAIGFFLKKINVSNFAIGIFLFGLTEIYLDSVARISIPELFEESDRPKIYAFLSNIEVIMNQLAGTSIGGLLFTYSMGLHFSILSALSCIAAVFFDKIIRSINRQEPSSTPKLKFGDDVLSGFKFIFQDPVRKNFVFMTIAGNFATSAAFSVLGTYLLNERGVSSISLSLIMGAPVIGNLMGTIFVDSLKKKNIETIIFRVIALTLPFLIATLAANSLIAISISLACIGILGLLWSSFSESLLGRITPTKIRGRVLSSTRTMTWGTAALSSLAAGPIADAWGVKLIFFSAAIIVTLKVYFILKLENALLNNSMPVV